MVSAALDTSIVVDLLRGYQPAEQWLRSQINFGVSRSVWLEILDGAGNRSDQRRALLLLRDFELIPLVNDDFEWAATQLLRYRLSHNVHSMDCLIAAPAWRLQLPLFTHNLRHFRPMIGDLARQPY